MACVFSGERHETGPGAPPMAAEGPRGAENDRVAVRPGSVTDATRAHFRNYQDIKWNWIAPDLSASSPEICILSGDAKADAMKRGYRRVRSCSSPWTARGT